MDNLNALGTHRKVKKKNSFRIEKEVKKLAKDGNECVVPISYKIKSIDSGRFMSCSLLC